MSTNNMTTIAVLGATGECAGWALIQALRNGHNCRALARNPAKLTKFILDRQTNGKFVVDETQKSGLKPLSEVDLAQRLVIVEGNAKMPTDVKKLLTVSGDNDSNVVLVDHILFGIGAAASIGFTPSLFVFSDPKVCEDGMTILIDALQNIPSTTKKPYLTVISTTGIVKPRDVPILFVPFYHWCLAVPHKDKRKMEAVLANSGRQVFAKYTIVRPSLLVGGFGVVEQKLMSKDYTPVLAKIEHPIGNGVVDLSPVRSGVRSKPAVGYTIARKDVGLWIYENILKNTADNVRCAGEEVTLTT